MNVLYQYPVGQMTLKNLKASTYFRRISEAKVFVEDSLLGIDHDPKAEKHISAANDDVFFSERQSSTNKFCLKIVRIHFWWWT